MKIVYRAKDILEAHIVAGMLRAEGIEAHVGGHYLQGGVGDLAPMDFATVLVSEPDVDGALVLVREYEGEPSTGPERSPLPTPKLKPA